jgi:phenylacetate-coenzyme A ligase PaaK-like adenylate-forming protein
MHSGRAGGLHGGVSLIRYRTGDRAALKLDSCLCRTVLKTLDPIRGRRDNQIETDRRVSVSTGTGKRRIRDLRKQEGYP